MFNSIKPSRVFRCVESDHKRLQAVVCQIHELTVFRGGWLLWFLSRACELIKLGLLWLFTKRYGCSCDMLRIMFIETAAEAIYSELRRQHPLVCFFRFKIHLSAVSDRQEANLFTVFSDQKNPLGNAKHRHKSCFWQVGLQREGQNTIISGYCLWCLT